MSIAVVVPTYRPESLMVFKAAWGPLLARHSAQLVVVHDGNKPTVNGMSVEAVLGAEDADLIYNHSDVVRNLGFAYVARYLPEAEVIVTLDDDVLPEGDTLQAHLNALARRYPLGWMSTMSEYVRGVPYGVRDEAPCMVSHGVWRGVLDWDAPTQLVLGAERDATPHIGAIPRGVLFPLCGMNVAFKREVLPWMYFAPMGPSVGVDRFGDIWCGVHLKRACDQRGWAIATGYAVVRHERASNVYTNLQKEARGLQLHEGRWLEVEGGEAYMTGYAEARQRWAACMERWL